MRERRNASVSSNSVRIPFRLVGQCEGGGDGRTADVGFPPTPNPSPQEGGEPRSNGGGEIISLCGTTFTADSSGALYWHDERTLLVADLHLEKGSSHAERGIMLPPYDTRETLARLAAVVGRYDPARIIALGDSFHDIGGSRRIGTDDLESLRTLQRGREWVWIAGNHDPAIGPRVGGRLCDELLLGGLTLRHEPVACPTTHEIAGHMHPAARLSANGASIRRPCFVGNGSRLVMPAFGAFTGGLNVLDDAFRPLFGPDLASGGFAVWMLGRDALYPVATHRLSAD